MRRRNRFQRGVTIAEVMVTTLVSTTVLFAALSLFITGTANWARGESAIDVESNSRQGVRRMVNELREAMYVSVDGDGMGVTYRKPKKDTDGNFVLPMVWDGYDRRIYFTSGQVWMSDGVNPAWKMARSVIAIDPFLGTGNAVDQKVRMAEDANADNSRTGISYRVFTPGSGTVTRSVTVKLVTRNPGGLRAVVHGRNRETIYLRNVPQVAK